MNAGAPTAVTEYAVISVQQRGTEKPTARISLGKLFKKGKALPALKRRIKVETLSRSAEALLPPHECGGSHRGHRVCGHLCSAARDRETNGEDQLRETLQEEGRRCQR